MASDRRGPKTDTTTTISHGENVYPQPGTDLWEPAWGALIATGRDPGGDRCEGAEGSCGHWMLMQGTRAEVPGGYRWSFKRRHYGPHYEVMNPKNEHIQIPGSAFAADGAQIRDMSKHNPDLADCHHGVIRYSCPTCTAR